MRYTRFDFLMVYRESLDILVFLRFNFILKIYRSQNCFHIQRIHCIKTSLNETPKKTSVGKSIEVHRAECLSHSHEL